MGKFKKKGSAKNVKKVLLPFILTWNAWIALMLPHVFAVTRMEPTLYAPLGVCATKIIGVAIMMMRVTNPKSILLMRSRK